MNKSLLLLVVLISGSALLSSYSGGKQSTAEPTTYKEEIITLNKLFSDNVSKGDFRSAGDYYTTDAKFMAPNGPAVVGRQNITAALGGMIASGVTALVLTTENVWGDKKMLGEEGTYTLGTKDGTQLDKGKYIVLWKKEDGKWKAFRDIFNSDLPVPGSK